MLAHSPASAVASGPAPLQPILLAVTLNGQASAEPTLLLRGAVGELFAGAGAFATWRLRLPAVEPTRFEGDLYYPLAAVAGVSLRLADAQQAVTIDAPATAFEHQNDEIAETREVAMTAPSSGGFLSYDLFADYSRGKGSVNGAFEGVLFTPRGVGSTTFIAQVGAGPDRLVRLESAWTIDRPNSMTSIRLGDSISSTGPGAAPVRFAGIQYARNFGVRPGFLTMPLATAQGSAAVASVVDVYVNNALQASQPVGAGPFELTRIPLQGGAGTVHLVVHDLLGRELVSDESYYSAPESLRRGLHDFSYEVGFLRRDFGRRSNSYGELMAMASHRYGLTDKITIEGHVQASAAQQMGAVGVSAVVFDLAQIGGSVSVSHSGQGVGYRLAASAERHASALSFGIRAETTSASYAFIGMSQLERQPRYLVQAFADIATPFGAVGVDFIHRAARDGPDQSLTGIFATARISDRASLQLFARRTVAGTRQMLFGAHLAFVLGGSRSASAGIEGDRHGASGDLSYQVNTPSGPGGGYRLTARFGPGWGAEAGYVRNLPMATIRAEVAHANSATGVRLSASGAIGFLGGTVFASRTLGESFAAVRVPGRPGVRVYADNHLVGVTDHSGALIVPGLRAYDANRIRIDESDLPLDAALDAAEVAVRPFARTGTTLLFAVRNERGVLMRVQLADGRPLPAGARVAANGNGETYVAVSGGEVYAPNLVGTVRLRATWAGGSCAFTAIVPANDEPQPLLEGLVCLGSESYAVR